MGYLILARRQRGARVRSRNRVCAPSLYGPISFRYKFSEYQQQQLLSPEAGASKHRDYHSRFPQRDRGMPRCAMLGKAFVLSPPACRTSASLYRSLIIPYRALCNPERTVVLFVPRKSFHPITFCYFAFLDRSFEPLFSSIDPFFRR